MPPFRDGPSLWAGSLLSGMGLLLGEGIPARTCRGPLIWAKEPPSWVSAEGPSAWAGTSFLDVGITYGRKGWNVWNLECVPPVLAYASRLG